MPRHAYYAVQQLPKAPALRWVRLPWYVRAARLAGNQQSYSIQVFKDVDVSVAGFPCTSSTGSRLVSFSWDPERVALKSATLAYKVTVDAGATLKIYLNDRVAAEVGFSGAGSQTFEDAVDVTSLFANGANRVKYDYHIDFGFWKGAHIDYIVLTVVLESLEPGVPPAPTQPPQVQPEPPPPQWDFAKTVVIGLLAIGGMIGLGYLIRSLEGRGR